MTTEVKQIPVHLLGKEYLVACKADESDELLASARMLDGKMREIRETGKVIGTERIAVMAALNLAHELLRKGNRESSGAAQEAIYACLKTISEKIDAVLAQDERQLKI